MVMAVPAAPGWAPGHIAPVVAELPSDPRPPLDVLAYWTNTWRSLCDQPTGLPATIERACDYLDQQLHHIARDPIFPGLARDLARVRHQLETVLHAGVRPELTHTPCWDCGSRLARVWGATAATDCWRCGVCGQVYDQHRYTQAQHMHLLGRGADRYVALADAVAVTGRPYPTVQAWGREGMVAARRTHTGRVEVWWPDVRDRHRTTPLRRAR